MKKKREEVPFAGHYLVVVNDYYYCGPTYIHQHGWALESRQKASRFNWSQRGNAHSTARRLGGRVVKVTVFRKVKNEKNKQKSRPGKGTTGAQKRR